MTVLHILKTAPDETVRELMRAFAEDEAVTVPLFEGEVDWEDLVDEIFSADRVICWW